MSDAPAPVVKTPAKSPKKKAAAKPKKVATHPKYSEMVGKAISALKERGGSSRQAILKYILANFSVGSDAKTVNTHLKLALKSGVKSNSLKQSKGTGASGSFKIGEVAKPAKKPAKKVVKPKAAKPKKAKTPTKKTAAKKPAAKKPAGEKKAAKPKAKETSCKRNLLQNLLPNLQRKPQNLPRRQRLQLNQRRQRHQRRSK
ncbi:histone H1/5 [Mytilus galloprovincialis]|uniref:Histone H1/5 n=1 Tax=Mytilus galloprovincialis TaxID=29158 RepID=A0A8B6E1B8_MYTGA|nr:histone H1/5 [Mytilus galloprovincialis]